MTAAVQDAAQALRHAMVDRLVAAGEITTGWEPAMRDVPRHSFLPGTIWERDPSVPGPYDLVPFNRRSDPQRWLERAYADDSVITQVDDGDPAGPGQLGCTPTSSASMPLLVSSMLTALRAAPGHRVLEIGTGTGYNAALLSYRLGAENVTTVEVDHDVADLAQMALRGTGHAGVRVVVGDGERGHEPGAPYDGIIATAAVRRFPYQWVRQTRPGGRIVVPWAHPYLPALVVFDVNDNHTATGTVADPGADFMPARGQRMPLYSIAEVLAGADPDDAPATETDLHPYHVTGDGNAATAIGQRVPNCAARYWPACPEDDDHGTQWLLDAASGSWARLRHHPDNPGPYEVRQGGPRRLWDEVEAAWRWWDDHDRPPASAWRIEVGAGGQRVTLPWTAPRPHVPDPDRVIRR